MKTLKLIGKILGLLLIVTWLCFEVIPGPIEGNYHYIWRVSCLCDSVNFLKFENGEIRRYATNHGRSRHWGDYQKIGWNKYRIQTYPTIDDQRTFVLIVRPTLLALRVSELSPNMDGGFIENLITRIPFGGKYTQIIENDLIAWSNRPPARFLIETLNTGQRHISADNMK